MRLTSMQKMLGVVVIIAVVIVGAIGLLVVPEFAQLSQLAADREAAEQQVQQTETLLGQLRQAKTESAATQQALLQISNAFPETVDLPSVIIELQDVKVASGLDDWPSVKPGVMVTAPGNSYSEMPMTVNVTGEWSDVLDYLRRLNKMTRAIRVTDVSLAPVTNNNVATSGPPELSADIDMRAYVMTPNAQSPGSSPAPVASVQPASGQ